MLCPRGGSRWASACSRLLHSSPSTAQVAVPAIKEGTATASPLRTKVEGLVDAYEEFIGIKAVKVAQAQVIMWEERMSEAQLLRREKQAEIKNLQARLKEIHFDLDRTSRGEDKYLELLTEEHATIKKERALLEKFEGYETAEREAFHQLSTRVRDSHEKERERAEKTKWWGVTASLCGAFLGIIGSSIGNELRMRRFREMIPQSSDDFKAVMASLREQQQWMSQLLIPLGVSSPSPVDSAPSSSLGHQQIVDLVKAENKRLTAEIAALGKKLQLEMAAADPEAVVYVGSEMERLLDQTERNLESKMKLQTLLSVVVLYSALGLTIPVLWALFRG